MWHYVIPHFDTFLRELQLSTDDRNDASTKAERVARSLFAKYYPNQTFTHDCYLPVGSYGRGTATKPCTDLDLLFILPNEVFARINALLGNKQSQLLREMRETLVWTFPRTDLRADRQVVVAPFETYAVEIVPAFRLDDGTFLTANSNDGGSWRISAPFAEYNHLHAADIASDGKAAHLTMMAKAWNRECNVGLKSTSIEVLASIFASQWIYRDKGLFWYDWMIRDFFAFLFPYLNGWTRIIGTNDLIQLGDEWRTKLESAYNRSLKACEYEHADYGLAAAYEWQKIFGNQFKTTMHLIPALAAAIR